MKGGVARIQELESQRHAIERIVIDGDNGNGVVEDQDGNDLGC